MIWRSTLVFLTSLTAFTLPVASLQAQELPLQLAQQSSVVDPDAAIDTGEAAPDFSNSSLKSSLQQATTEQQAEEIRNLQQELKNRGFYDGPIDGIYGPKTEDAIRTLRGQAGTQSSDVAPSLFAPDSSETELPIQPEQDRENAESQDISDSQESQDDSVRINAEQGINTTDEINIEDDVSPETGTSDPETAVPEPTQANDSSVGAKLLWSSVALIAALSSFGIGFVLANRVKKDGVDGDTDEVSWGVTPKASASTNQEHATFPDPSLNGHTSNGHGIMTNGDGSAPETGVLIHQAPDQVNDTSPLLPAGQASSTTRLAKVDVIDELVSHLQVSDPSKRRKAIWELGQRGNSSAVQPLVNSMVDADSKEKSLILAALSEIGIRSLKPMNRALAIALQDDNPDVRKNAIRDLTRVYDLVTQISQMLGHATEDDDPEVRRTAEWALGQLNRIREAPKLKSSLNSLEASRPPSELLPNEVENLIN